MSYSRQAYGVSSISRSSARSASNDTGGTLSKGKPVRLDADGLQEIDVSIESQANSIAGVLKTDVNDGGTGEVITSGALEDITSYLFSIGDTIWVGKDGELSNVKPSIGVSGFVSADWVIRIGVVAENNDNPALTDLLVSIQIVGQL